MDYEQLKIKSFRHWDVYLHENQCYLGRTFVLLRDRRLGDSEIEDFLAIDGEVRDEFFLIGEKIKAALRMMFKPDKMNYAALSNVSEEIHVHFVPRYKGAREFAEVTFIDQRWGQNYAPYDRSFSVEEAILFEIRDILRQNM